MTHLSATEPRKADPPVNIKSHAPETAYAQAARALLDKKLTDGARRAASLFQHLETNVPIDAIVRAPALEWSYSSSGALAMGWDGTPLPLTRYAVGQLVTRASIPAEYLTRLAAGEPWARDLAVSTLARHYHEGTPKSRYLIRTVQHRHHAVLSDKFRRIDSRPLAEIAVQECQRVGAVPLDACATETRVALKAVHPDIVMIANDPVLLGFEWSNSDFGAGLNSVRTFVLRVACLNGATRDNVIKQVHLGGRLSDDVEFSRQTYELDTRASVSAMRDVVRGVLGEGTRNRVADELRKAQGTDMSWAQASAKVGKLLSKEEAAKAKEAFDGPDVLNLPAGNTAWRASNALSWIAKSIEDDERRLDVERAAGVLL